MSFPPLQPSSNSVPSGDSKSSNPGSVRPRQSAWGLSAPSTTRRGLTPLATNASSSSDAPTVRPDPTSPSTSAVAASPFAPSFSSVLHSANRAAGARNHSSSTAASPFPPLQAGSSQQQPPAPSGQPLSSPRSRVTTPFSTSNLASSAAGSTTASQGGGGSSGGGGPNARGAAFSPSPSTHSLTSPTNSTFDRGSLGSSSQSSSQSSVSKIVVTQVFLLLGSITEKEGKAKWDSQAEAIRKVGLPQKKFIVTRWC